MLEKDLIERSKEIQKELNTEIKESQKLGLQIEDYEQGANYINYRKSGSPIKSKNIFSSCFSEVREISLYVHLPFCISTCPFCCRFSVDKQSETIVEKYIGSLKNELELLTKTARLENAVVRNIFFGGGTPTYLSAKQLAELIGYLKSRLNVHPNTTFTCETTPEMIVGNAGKERIQALLENGVNRLSIGVQSFDDSILKLNGRNHNSKTAISAYRNACESGFRNINIDLMFGLSGQTLETWKSDLEITTNLNPGWVSVYRLRFNNPKLHEIYIKNPNLFPDKETVFLMNIMAIEKLTYSGYEYARAPSTFVLPSKSNYTPRFGLGETISIGVSAMSYVNGVRYHNLYNLKRYMMSVNKGRLPISFAGKYSKRQQLEREIILMLRSSKGINRSDVNSRFGIDIEKLFSEPLQKLRKSGMIVDDGETDKLTYKGLVFSAKVFKEFYSQDHFDRFKNMILNNKFSSRFYHNRKYSKSVVAISNIFKSIVGFLK